MYCPSDRLHLSRPRITCSEALPGVNLGMVHPVRQLQRPQGQACLLGVERLRLGRMPQGSRFSRIVSLQNCLSAKVRGHRTLPFEVGTRHSRFETLGNSLVRRRAPRTCFTCCCVMPGVPPQFSEQDVDFTWVSEETGHECPLQSSRIVSVQPTRGRLAAGQKVLLQVSISALCGPRVFDGSSLVCLVEEAPQAEASHSDVFQVQKLDVLDDCISASSVRSVKLSADTQSHRPTICWWLCVLQYRNEGQHHSQKRESRDCDGKRGGDDQSAIA